MIRRGRIIKCLGFEVPKNENTTIWKYMDFTKFVSLLDKQALFFVRADNLGDSFEGSCPKVMLSKRLDHYRRLFCNQELTTENISTIFKHLRELTVISCWHINRYESAAMWRLYLKSDEGIAIRSTFRRLRDCFTNKKEPIFIGKVRYIDYDKNKTKLDLLSPFRYKRQSFSHEAELRAIIRKPLSPKTQPYDDGLNVPVDLELLINKIYIAPTSPKWLLELIESVTRKYGLKKKVYQSILDEKPIY